MHSFVAIIRYTEKLKTGCFVLFAFTILVIINFGSKTFPKGWNNSPNTKPLQIGVISLLFTV